MVNGTTKLEELDSLVTETADQDIVLDPSNSRIIPANFTPEQESEVKKIIKDELELIKTEYEAEGFLAAVAEWFHARGRGVQVQDNDLSEEGLLLTGITASYARHGLQRRRECLLAKAGGVRKGFALLDISALGLNLSELTNAFTVHLEDDTDQDTRLALLLAARERYRELGRPQCIALDDGDDLDTYYAAGFRSSKDYCCFTFHRQHLAEMEAYFQDLFLARFRSKA